MLPLRDVVVFPHMVVPLFVGRDKSIQALEAAMEGSKEILLIAQKDAGTDDPGAEDVFSVGTIATVLQMLKLPDGTVKVLVEGNTRARITEIHGENYLSAQVETILEEDIPEREAEVLSRTLMEEFEKYVKLSKKVPSEVSNSLSGYQRHSSADRYHGGAFGAENSGKAGVAGRGWRCGSVLRRFWAGLKARST